MTFYDRVNQLCREHGMSITALALALGFSKGTPSNWKTMTKPPRAENVKKIAEYFGVTVASLMEDSVIREEKNDDPHNITIRGRNGAVIKKNLTDEQLQLIQQMIEQLEKK